VRPSIRLGKVAGIAVGCNWSVLVILALFAWELAAYVLPTTAGAPSAADWAAGVVGAVVLLASLLAHEVSHALVAKRHGVTVRSITLFVFGGVTQLEGEAHTPGADFAIAAIGPGTSIGLAGVFGALEWLASGAGVHGLVLGVLSWLWKVNLLLAVFNLVPAAPLDGGRILRSVLWRRSGDHDGATVTAARAGRGFAVLLIVVGVLGFFSGGLLGVWPALIGVFLYAAARAEEEYGRMRARIGSLRVGQVMTPHPPVVSGDISVADLVNRYLWGYHGEAAVVRDAEGRPAGIVTTAAVRALEPDRRAAVTVAEIMAPRTEVSVGRADEPMTALLERMATGGYAIALVLDAEDRLAGIVTDRDLRRAAALAPGSRGGGPRQS